MREIDIAVCEYVRLPLWRRSGTSMAHRHSAHIIERREGRSLGKLGRKKNGKSWEWAQWYEIELGLWGRGTRWCPSSSSISRVMEEQGSTYVQNHVHIQTIYTMEGFTPSALSQQHQHCDTLQIWTSAGSHGHWDSHKALRYQRRREKES